MEKCLNLIISSIIIFFALFVSVKSQDWTKIPTSFDNILRVYSSISNSSILAISSSVWGIDFNWENIPFESPFFFGNGIQISQDSGKTFSQTKLDSHIVLDLLEAPGNENVWYASTSYLSRGRILKSTDKGLSWNTSNELCESSYHIFRLDGKVNNGEKYFAAAINTGRGFITSADSFRTCVQSNKISVQLRDVKISKINRNYIFLAGDNNYEEGVYRSSDNGNTWQKDISGLEHLRILCVQPSSLNLSWVYCGADSVDEFHKSHGRGIYRSQDTGKTWELILYTGSSIYELKEHPSNPFYMVAAAGTSGVWTSASGGFVWKQYKEGLPDTASVQTIAVPDWQITSDGVIAFAGTASSGLYRSGRMITSVESRQSSVANNFLIYPQPASNELNVILIIDTPHFLELKISGIEGQQFYHEKRFAESGNKPMNIPLNNLANGLYSLSVTIGSEHFNKIFIVYK